MHANTNSRFASRTYMGLALGEVVDGIALSAIVTALTVAIFG